jgi:hypothetical protein
MLLQGSLEDACLDLHDDLAVSVLKQFDDQPHLLRALLAQQTLGYQQRQFSLGA